MFNDTDTVQWSEECGECGEPSARGELCPQCYEENRQAEAEMREDLHNDERECGELGSYYPERDNGEPSGSWDLSDDADALASAGFGTDEDYGYSGDMDFDY